MSSKEVSVLFVMFEDVNKWNIMSVSRQVVKVERSGECCNCMEVNVMEKKRKNKRKR